MNAFILTRLSHSRGFGLTVALLAAVAAAVYFFDGYTEFINGDMGLGLPSANQWFGGNNTLSFAVAIAANAATAVIMLLLNKIFNVFRAMTSLYLAFFAVMQLAQPGLMTQFYTGNLLVVVIPLCLFLLFSCYRQPDTTRRIYMIALLLSALTATQYCYALYLPAFLIGCGQMGIFNRRTLAAVFMGIATPWIILIGFDIIDPAQLQWPHFANIFYEIDYDDTMLMLIAVGLTAFLAVVAYILTVFKTIAYNARTRAFRGAFTMVMLTTMAAMCVDYRNIISYIPMLNFSAAMEVTHLFTTHRHDKSYIAIFSIIAVYAVIFVCQTIV